MNDMPLKALALLAFVASLAALAVYVPNFDLIAVLVVVVAMALYDFMVRPALARYRRKRT
jgi:membrane protein YdbS with pleckstrin-like domain